MKKILCVASGLATSLALQMRPSTSHTKSSGSYRLSRDLGEVIEFKSIGKYIMCITDEGMIKVYDPFLRKLVKASLVQKEDKSLFIFTSICYMDTGQVAVSSVHKIFSETTNCQIRLLSARHYLTSSLEFESKSHKINGRKSFTLFDINPVH